MTSVVNRRVFVGALVGGVLSSPLAAEAQQAAKIVRIGYLDLAAPPQRREAFRHGLRDLGYVEGRNVVIEYRSAEGKPERLPTLAAELVALKVDVIVAQGTPQALAAKQATRTLPIVFAGVPDPVTTGLVTSLARPGGNVTGTSLLAPELVGKRLEQLTQAVPGVSRVAVLWQPGAVGERTEKDILKGVEIAARRWGCGYKILKGTNPADLPVEQPTKFELVINLKAAKALDLTIPPSLLGRAEEVIQ